MDTIYSVAACKGAAVCNSLEDSTFLSWTAKLDHAVPLLAMVSNVAPSQSNHVDVVYLDVVV